MSLSHDQERAVGVTLRLLEERLTHVERIVEEDEEGILYRRHAPFSPEQREEIHAAIAAMREQIRLAAETFYFPKEEQNPIREIVGTLSLTWESLEESRPRKLKAYGEVDPALEETLEPILHELIRLLFTIVAAAQGKQAAVRLAQDGTGMRESESAPEETSR